jgi:SOS-response transcriptional repressor LexA
MWDISPGQAAACGIFRQSRRVGQVCDISQMEGRPDIHAIREKIAGEMERRGLSRRGLSTAAGLSQTAVRDLLERTENPGIGTLSKVAEALEIPFEAVSGIGGVPLGGEIGAGGEIAYFKDGAADQETVPRPPLPFGPMIAFKVKGTSMLPKYEAGDIVYIRRTHEGVLPGYIGKYCAVHLDDGGTYLKRLVRGATPCRYTLQSINADDMTDVEVVWASPVLFVMPAEALAEIKIEAAR